MYKLFYSVGGMKIFFLDQSNLFTKVILKSKARVEISVRVFKCVVLCGYYMTANECRCIVKSDSVCLLCTPVVHIINFMVETSVHSSYSQHCYTQR